MELSSFELDEFSKMGIKFNLDVDTNYIAKKIYNDYKMKVLNVKKLYKIY